MFVQFKKTYVRVEVSFYLLSETICALEDIPFLYKFISKLTYWHCDEKLSIIGQIKNKYEYFKLILVYDSDRYRSSNIE